MTNVPNITQNFARPSYRPETPAGMDPDMRRMAIAAAGVAGLVALVIGAVGLSHRVHHGLPVIEAVAGPVRVKPLDPGGMKVAGAEDPTSGVEALAPAAEKPALHALRKSHLATLSHPSVETASAPASPPIAPIAAPIARAATLSQPAAMPAMAPPSPAIRGTSVQLAAFDSQQAAEQDWGKLAERIPGLFDGHRPEVERAQVAGHAVFRLRTGGFADIAAATTFCGKVRAKGGGCTIAAF